MMKYTSFSANLKSSEQIANEVQRVINLTKAVFRKYRSFFIGAFTLFLVIGCYMAIHSSEIRIADLNPSYLLVLVLIFPFLSYLYGIAGLQLSSQIIKPDIHFSFWEALKINVTAEAAHILPIPGGAIVKTAALNEKGANLAASATVITIFAILLVTIAAMIAGSILMFTDQFLSGAIMFGISSVVVLACFFWVFKKCGLQITLLLLGHRLIGIFITAGRLFFAFATIGILLPFSDTFVYSLAVLAGSTAGITPAGLGVSEVLSSLMAYGVGDNISFAFLAILLDRIVSTLAFSTIYLTGLMFSFGSTKTRDNHVA